MSPDRSQARARALVAHSPATSPTSASHRLALALVLALVLAGLAPAASAGAAGLDDLDPRLEPVSGRLLAPPPPLFQPLLAPAAPAPAVAVASAMPRPLASPPGWQPAWRKLARAAVLYASWSGDEALARLPAGAYARLDAPAHNGRSWVYSPASGDWGWLPNGWLVPWQEPTWDEVRARPEPPHPRLYLYRRWPHHAPRMDCVIWFESSWNPRARNATSGAAGLAQFLDSTWARTPHGRAGYSPYDPYAAIDAFAWMIQGGGSWQEWEVVQLGLC